MPNLFADIALLFLIISSSDDLVRNACYFMEKLMSISMQCCHGEPQIRVMALRNNPRRLHTLVNHASCESEEGAVIEAL